MMYSDYNPFVTAISRGRLSAPTNLLKRLELLKGSILDYGCGKGDDVAYLKQEGYDATGYDKYNKTFYNEFLCCRYYQTIICNYVFNVIPSFEEIANVKHELEHLGEAIYISVRSDIKAIQDNWDYDSFAQGYWTKNSFQRFYNKGMVVDEFKEVKFIPGTGGSFILFKWEVDKL